MSRYHACQAFFFIIIICSSIKVLAQNPEKTYYNSSWKKCDASKACYLSQLLKTDSGYYRTDYFINNGALQMAALFEDEACKIQNGQASYYYATGRPAGSDRKVHGKKEGVVINYHNNGVMADSAFYHDGQQIGAAFRWHYNGALADSIAATTDSVRVHVMWFDDGLPAGAGREIKGKKTGLWVFYHHNGNPASREVYKDNKLISEQQYDETGSEMTLDTSRNERAATIKGGLEAWHKYLVGALEWPENFTFSNVDQVELQVEMTIGENGKIGNVYVVNPLHPVFDKIAYTAISKGPLWQPAIQHNHTVTSSRSLL